MLRGTMVAVITPMKSNRIDERALRRLVRFHEDRSTDVIVPCGTTGESATLSYEEHENVIEIVVDEADDLTVMPGTGSNSTHEAKRLTQHALEVGADYGLAITPYYNKPPQRGMINHFRTLASDVNLDLVLYNVPSRTGINLEPETVAELSEVNGIVGIKEASGDISKIAEICRLTPDDFSVLSGDDSMTLPLLSVGGHGVVSVLANLLPDKVSDVVKAWQKSSPVRAREKFQELIPLMNAMFWETNPMPVKAGAYFMGLCEKNIRSPLSWLDEEYHEPLKDLLRDQGVNLENE